MTRNLFAEKSLDIIPVRSRKATFKPKEVNPKFASVASYSGFLDIIVRDGFFTFRFKKIKPRIDLLTDVVNSNISIGLVTQI